jgi:hypothetical protein
MMAAYNFIQLLRDLAIEQGLPQPRYHPVGHPLPNRMSALCIFNNLDCVGSGSNIFEARNASAREMWRQLGHGSYRDNSNGMDVPYVHLRSPFVPRNLLGGNFLNHYKDSCNIKYPIRLWHYNFALFAPLTCAFYLF